MLMSGTKFTHLSKSLQLFRDYVALYIWSGLKRPVKCLKPSVKTDGF